MKISRLLLKYLKNEATNAELQEIYQWVNESDANRNAFAEIKNGNAYLTSTLNPDDSTIDYTPIKKSIVKAIKNKKGVLQYYKIAAAVLLPVLLVLSSAYYYAINFKYSEPVYTEIIAPPKHNSQIILSDSTQVWLSPESSLKFAQTYSDKERVVDLSGEGYFEVSHNAEKPFYVNTNLLKVKVLGTSFNVEAYPGDQIIRTTLVRGSVEVLASGSQSSVLLSPGDRLSFNTETKAVKIEKVNTGIYRLV
ncbi:MAG TPA: FecR family protein, partial [Prolixibacteraceae bacterium]|nr:FecR family protein [Prolixibacteraceae bacterium]